MVNSKESLAKNFNMIESSMDKMWDMWLVSMNSLSWTQEQMENMARKQLDQNKTAREEMIKLVEELSKQMRRNQGQFQKMVEEAITNTYTHINHGSQSMFADLTKQVEGLVKKADTAEKVKKQGLPLVATG